MCACITDVVVGFESSLYRVSESSAEVMITLILQGDTSNTVAVTITTFDREAIGKW